MLWSNDDGILVNFQHITVYHNLPNLHGACYFLSYVECLPDSSQSIQYFSRVTNTLCSLPREALSNTLSKFCTPCRNDYWGPKTMIRPTWRIITIKQREELPEKWLQLQLMNAILPCVCVGEIVRLQLSLNKKKDKV